MGFAAGAVVAVVGADLLGWDASANDEAPKAAMEMTLNAVPPKIRARPTLDIFTVLPFLHAAGDAQTVSPGVLVEISFRLRPESECGMESLQLDSVVPFR